MCTVTSHHAEAAMGLGILDTLWVECEAVRKERSTHFSSFFFLVLQQATCQTL